MTNRRSLPVPDGLDGLRLDAAVARLFGLSRTTAATLVEDGNVMLDGTVPAKSTRVPGGAWLEGELPPPPGATEAVPPAMTVPGLRVVHDDDDLVVVDKPPGVAAHPSPGWDGPTVTQGLAGAGYRISTSGSAERQGGGHRLRRGPSVAVVGG